MTYLEALRRKLGVDTIDETLAKVIRNDGVYCPAAFDLGDGWCPAVTRGKEDIAIQRSGCLRCWAREYPDPIVHEEVETIYPCTVQILRDPETGEESVGWFRGQMDGE